MKIKFQEVNKQQKNNSKSVRLFDKENEGENNNSPIQKGGKRVVGKDITKREVNTKYNFLARGRQNKLVLPSYLIPKMKIAPQIKQYEQEILDYIINTYDQYAPATKNVGKRQRRVKVVQFFIVMCQKYKLKKKTLFLSTYYFDKFRQRTELTIEKYSIAAQACLLIAMKYQQIYPPFLKDWCSNVPQVIKMQALILSQLKFKLAFTTARHYLEIYLSKRPEQSKERALLYECLLEFYLVIGKIYKEHPLKVVQQVIQSFKTTAFLQNDTPNTQINKRLQLLIKQNLAIWESVLENNRSYQFK